MYLSAVEDAFGGEIDYAMLHKVYRSNPEGETRYSPAKCIGCVSEDLIGTPEPKHISPIASFSLLIFETRSLVPFIHAP